MEFIQLTTFTISNNNATPSRLVTAINPQYILRVSEIGGTFYKGRPTPFYQVVSSNNNNVCIIDADGAKRLGISVGDVKEIG